MKPKWKNIEVNDKFSITGAKTAVLKFNKNEKNIRMLKMTLNDFSHYIWPVSVFNKQITLIMHQALYSPYILENNFKILGWKSNFRSGIFPKLLPS